MDESHLTTTAIDRALQSLVDMANECELGFPVTLFVGGLVVSGHLMSAAAYVERTQKEYWEAIAEHYGLNESEEYKTAIRYVELRAEDIKATKQPATHIHLRNTVVQIADVIAVRDVIWRGKLSAVDGFMIGRPVSHDPSPDILETFEELE